MVKRLLVSVFLGCTPVVGSVSDAGTTPQNLTRPQSILGLNNDDPITLYNLKEAFAIFFTQNLYPSIGGVYPSERFGEAQAKGKEEAEEFLYNRSYADHWIDEGRGFDDKGHTLDKRPFGDVVSLGRRSQSMWQRDHYVTNKQVEGKLDPLIKTFNSLHKNLDTAFKNKNEDIENLWKKIADLQQQILDMQKKKRVQNWR